MNQILEKFKSKKHTKFLKLQLVLSILGILAILFFYNKTSHNQSENYSKEILVSQKIDMIYNLQKLSHNEDDSEFFCSIEIPKIEIVYPVFNKLSEESLLISPCKFSGPKLNEFGNIAIAGHNLENHTFFSDLNKLNIDDKIILTSLSGEKYEYLVYRTYETESEDLSPLDKNFIERKELTLVTCNNKNKKSFIVKALLNN